MAKRLSKAAIETVKDSPDLYAEVCKALEIKPGSLRTILQRNPDYLSNYSIVELVASHMGIPIADAVEEYESEAA